MPFLENHHLARQMSQDHIAEASAKAGKRVVLGMSGGVDSSVAAHLLMEQGYAVEGLFMKNWEEDDGSEYCTAITDLEDARAVCEKLGLKLHTANFSAEYWDNVFEHFLGEYKRWRTPNPDILCNREIKFQQFVDYATSLGADYIATGHYVRRSGGLDTQQPFKILKGVDDKKDQTYFLQAVPAKQLEKCLFPLGDLEKTKVREIASDLGLANDKKKDSTGICFIGERRFADFLATYIKDVPGPIKDKQGRTLGEHRGLHYYTLGQRQGINIGGVAGRKERPWYVCAKQPQANTLIISQEQSDLLGDWLHADDANWLVEPSFPLKCHARIRYRQEDQACQISQAANGRLLVKFEQAQRAIAPGQYVALYDNDQMIGGAVIEHADKR
ncbi:MAG: tRNA-specific 2-thiouridylase [Candidatus Azotimanducaceae bacterium]|jgi:tRNA-specific 2-thiouridylase|tara:strand:- start:2097 stop:3254 length:1158 start_codon:yes stop_codon:yes gene_type:complete